MARVLVAALIATLGGVTRGAVALSAVTQSAVILGAVTPGAAPILQAQTPQHDVVHDSVPDLAREVARVTDASLPVADRQAAWLAIETAVDAFTARTDELSDAEARALFDGTDFFLRCLDDGAYEPQRVLPAIELALRTASARADEGERTGLYAFQSARLYLARSDLDRARAILEDALPKLAAGATSTRAWCLLLRGSVDRLAAQPVEANLWLGRALKELDPEHHASHRRLAPAVHAEIASAWLELGVVEMAARSVADQRAAAQGVDDPIVRHGLALQEERIDLASGRFARARDRARAAVADQATPFRDWPSIRAQHRLVQGLATQELARVDPAVQLDEFELLREAADDASLPRIDRAQACLSLFAAHARAGDVERASAALERAASEIETHTGGAPTLQTVRLAAARAREARLRKSSPADLARVRDALRVAWSEFRTIWNRTPIQKEGVGFLQYSFRRAVPCELVAAEIAADPGPAGVQRAFTTLLEAQASGTIARDLGLGVPTIAELRRELLVEGETLFAYLPGPFESHAFVLDATRLEHVSLAPDAELQRLQQEFAADLLVRPADGQAAPASARRLAKALFPAALAPFARGSKLTFTGLELLGFLPAAALDLDPIGELGLAAEIAEEPSLPLALHLARKPRHAASDYAVDLLVLAAPESTTAVREQWGGLAVLPWSAADERALRGDARGDAHDERVALLSRTEARASAVVARRPRFLSIHAHGVQDEHRSPPACLVLAPEREGEDGLFGVEDAARAWTLRADFTPPELIVLAVCGASRAQLRRGDDGVNHFGGALLAAGAQCVLLSSANLDDDAMRALLATLHAELLRGSTASAALLGARRALAAEPRFRHPHFHALLGASGLGHRTRLPR